MNNCHNGSAMTLGLGTAGGPRGEAREAVARGDLAAAVALLRSHLAENADPEARLELARLMLPLGDYDEAREQLETAFREFTDAGATKRAALAASHIGALYLSWIGNRVAGRAWLARAWRMIEQEEPCVERGWIATWDVGCQYDDPEDLRERAAIALETARSFSDSSLEVKALADGGLAMVEAGEVESGMGRLDEAMTLVTSGHADPLTAGQATCSLFVACWWTGDLARLEAWCEPLSQRGLIGEQGIPILTTHCDAVYGTLLCNVGRLGEAESVLTRLEQSPEHGPAAMRLRRAWALAELRIRQGRLSEAEQLLLGFDDQIEGLIPMARLHLARGDYELAAGAARRGLRLIGRDRVRAPQLLAVLVEAELGRDDLDSAREAAGDLQARAEATKSGALMAEAGFASATVFAVAGDTDRAIAELDRALERLGDIAVPLLRAKLRLELARLHAGSDRGAAVVEAKAAAAIHRRLQIPVPREYADVLRELGVDVSATEESADRPLGAGTDAVLSRGVDGSWTVTCGATVFRLRDTKGLRYLAELVEQPGVERHVLDLVEVADPAGENGAVARHRIGDAGPLIDAQAKAAYRRRIEQLREEVQGAEMFGHYEKAATLQAELDAIVHQLAGALGLGGRDRRASSTAERARLNVTRAIRAAIARISQWDESVGRALDQDVSTGYFCSYQPQQGSGARWRAERSPQKPSTQMSRNSG
jgi:tetratricopeptide (TPR) repeat protein